MAINAVHFFLSKKANSKLLNNMNLPDDMIPVYYIAGTIRSPNKSEDRNMPENTA